MFVPWLKKIERPKYTESECFSREVLRCLLHHRCDCFWWWWNFYTFIFHGVSFAVRWWWGERSRYLYPGKFIFNSECISVEAVNDTRESEWEIKLWKLRLNFSIVYNIPQLLEFSASGIEFRLLNTQFSSFSLQRAIIVIITFMLYVWSLFFAKSFKLQENIFSRNRLKFNYPCEEF